MDKKQDSLKDRQIDRQQIDRQQIDRQIDRQTVDRQTVDRQTVDRQTDRQIDRQIDRQTDSRQIDSRQIDIWIDKQIDIQKIDRQIDRQRPITGKAERDDAQYLPIRMNLFSRLFVQLNFWGDCFCLATLPICNIFKSSPSYKRETRGGG